MSDGKAALRRHAARRRLAGKSPAAIAVDLGRDRQWVAKWAGRYDPEDPGWTAGRSRAPGHVANLTERASAFERFRNARHRYSATRGRTPRRPPPPSQAYRCQPNRYPPTGPKHGKVEFVRFIRSDQRRRILGRAIPMPGHSAYRYVTATLDLSLSDQDNLLISDTDGSC